MKLKLFSIESPERELSHAKPRFGLAALVWPGGFGTKPGLQLHPRPRLGEAPRVGTIRAPFKTSDRHSDFGFRISDFELCTRRAFTLLEVMIAIAIFFVASFAILSLVASSLDNVRRIQRPSVDASPVLARFAAFDKLTNGIYQGNLGEPELLDKDYRDYNYTVDVEEIYTNHLYRVRCVIMPASGKHQVISDLTTVLYKPNSPPGPLDGGIGLTGH